jgi:hypothetical protein
MYGVRNMLNTIDIDTPRHPALTAEASCEMLKLEGLAIALRIVEANNRGSKIPLTEEEQNLALGMLVDVVTDQVRVVAKLTLEDEEGSR